MVHGGTFQLFIEIFIPVISIAHLFIFFFYLTLIYIHTYFHPFIYTYSFYFFSFFFYFIFNFSVVRSSLYIHVKGTTRTRLPLLPTSFEYIYTYEYEYNNENGFPSSFGVYIYNMLWFIVAKLTICVSRAIFFLYSSFPSIDARFIHTRIIHLKRYISCTPISVRHYRSCRSRFQL